MSSNNIKDHNIELLILSGLFDDDVNGSRETYTWGELIEYLREPEEVDRKNDTSLFCYWTPVDEDKQRYKKKGSAVANISIKIPNISNAQDLGFNSTFPDEENVLNKITKGGLLDSLGLKNKDIIEKVNGRYVSNTSKAVQALLESENQENEVTIIRNGGSLRINDNVDTVNAIVLDLDEEGAREQAEEIFKDYEYILHSSTSYCSQTPYKFRMILPLETPIQNSTKDYSEWHNVYDSLKTVIDLDPQCRNPSRGFFGPAQVMKQTEDGSRVPVSDLAPVFEYNPAGRFVDKSFILELGKANGLTFDKQKKSFKTKSNSERYDLDGTEISKNTFIKDPSYDFEDILLRHEKNIKDAKNSRDMFTYKTIRDELELFGEKADLKKLIIFMFELCEDKQYSNRSLRDPRSSSGKHEMLVAKITNKLGEMNSVTPIESIAIREKIEQDYGNIQNLVDDAINEANDRLNAKSKIQDDVKYDYKSMKQRSSKLTEKLIAGEINKIQFLNKYFQNECEIADERKINLPCIIEYLYRNIKENLGTSIPVDEKKTEWNRTVENIFRQSINTHKPEILDIFKMDHIDKLIDSLCDKASIAAEKDRWINLDRQGKSNNASKSL